MIVTMTLVWLMFGLLSWAIEMYFLIKSNPPIHLLVTNIIAYGGACLITGPFYYYFKIILGI